MKRLLLFLLLIFIVGCTEIPIEEPIKEEMTWTIYENDLGFSIDHPDAEGTFDFNETLFIIPIEGCNLAVNKYDGNDELMYEWLLTYLANENIEVIKQSEIKKEIEYTNLYETYLIYNKVKVFSCNNYAYNIILSCEHTLYDEEKFSQFFTSAQCDTNKKEEIKFNNYNDEDFSMQTPNWEESKQQDTIILKQDYCNVYISETNSKLDDVYNWMYTTMDNCEDCSITKIDDTTLEYTSYYNDILLKSKAGFNYCNYKTYTASYTCVESMFDEDTADTIIESIDCAKIYEPEVEEEIQEEITQEKEEEIEIIEDEVVNLNLPEEWEVENPEMIVWFINSNDFFTYILSDYDKVNLIIKDDENFNIKADLENGKIVKVEEGLYEGEVSIIIPLGMALEILNNADNINFLNFLVYAAQIETDPPELKQQVINKILGL